MGWKTAQTARSRSVVRQKALDGQQPRSMPAYGRCARHRTRQAEAQAPVCAIVARALSIFGKCARSVIGSL